MNNEDLLNAMSDIDPKLLQECYNARKVRRSSAFRTGILILVAAGILFTILSTVFLSLKMRGDATAASKESETADSAENAEETSASDTVVLEPVPVSSEHLLSFHQEITVPFVSAHIGFSSVYTIPQEIRNNIDENAKWTIAGGSGLQENGSLYGHVFEPVSIPRQAYGSSGNETVIRFADTSDSSNYVEIVISYENIRVSAYIKADLQNYNPSSFLRLELWTVSKPENAVLFTIDIKPVPAEDMTEPMSYDFGLNLIQNIPASVSDYMRLNEDRITEILKASLDEETLSGGPVYLLKPFRIYDYTTALDIRYVRYGTSYENELVTGYYFPVVSGDRILTVLLCRLQIPRTAEAYLDGESELTLSESTAKLAIFLDEEKDRSYLFEDNHNRQVAKPSGMFSYSSRYTINAGRDSHDSTETVFMDLTGLLE